MNFTELYHLLDSEKIAVAAFSESPRTDGIDNRVVDGIVLKFSRNDGRHFLEVTTMKAVRSEQNRAWVDWV